MQSIHDIQTLHAARETHPNYCKVYARKTPTIPFHNGITKCYGCHKRIAGPSEVHAWQYRVLAGAPNTD